MIAVTLLSLLTMNCKSGNGTITPSMALLRQRLVRSTFQRDGVSYPTSKAIEIFEEAARLSYGTNQLVSPASSNRSRWQRSSHFWVEKIPSCPCQQATGSLLSMLLCL